MMSTPFVRYALRVTEARIARSDRRAARARRITLVVGWLIFLGVAGFLLVLLWNSWQSDSWGDFWAYARDIWPAASATYLAGRLEVVAERNTIARAVRRVVTADGDQQVVLANDQPMPLEGSILTADPVRIARLPRPLADSVLGLWIIATMCFLIGGMSLLFALTLPGELAPLRIVGQFLLALTVLLIAAAELRRHDSPIIADRQGLRWRPWGWPFHQVVVRWHEVRRFYVLRSRRSTDGAAESTYVLESDRIHLIWRVHSGMKPTRRAASELLLRLIASNAGLPLRDVTAALRPLDDPGAT